MLHVVSTADKFLIDTPEINTVLRFNLAFKNHLLLKNSENFGEIFCA